MKTETLKTEVEKLEELVSSDKDFIQAENKARILLKKCSKMGIRNLNTVKSIVEIKVRILLVLLQSFQRRGLYNDAKEFVENILLLINEIENPRLEMKIYNSVGNIYASLCMYNQTITYYNQALSIAKHHHDQDSVSACLSNLGVVYMEQTDYQRALECFSQSLILDEELKRIKGIAACHVNLGVVYWKLSDYSSALTHYEKALIFNKELDRKSSVANILSNMGVVYYSIADYKKSLECHRQSLSIYEELGVKNGIARNFGNLANIYKEIDDYDKAIEYYQKSLVIYEEIGKKDAIALLQGNLGLIYARNAHYDISLNYYEKALVSYETLQVKDGIARVLVNIGSIYRQIARFDDALDYLNKALSIDTEISCDEGIAADLGNIALVYGDKEFNKYSFRMSENYFARALSLSKELGLQHQVYTLHKSLADLYKGEQEWEKYSYHIEQYHSLEKEVQSIEVKKQADRFDLVRQIMEKEKARAIAERDGEIQRLRAEELTRNIALMKKELEELIERLVRKSQFIRSISGKLEYAMSLTNGESRRAVYSVIELLDERVGDEEDRIVVLLQLRAVYGDFMSRLSSYNTELNDGEIKTCALMLMHLSTSKIAITLGVSERTVEKYRSTIRKKLGIAAHGNIVAFLQQFLEE